VPSTARGTETNGLRASTPRVVAASKPMNAPSAGSTPAATPTRLQPGVAAWGAGGAGGPPSSTPKITSITAIETASTASTIRADTRTPRSTRAPASAARTTTAAAPTSGGAPRPSRVRNAPV
jgi:hypothetical protein